jgi:hypothetical protein
VLLYRHCVPASEQVLPVQQGPSFFPQAWQVDALPDALVAQASS